MKRKLPLAVERVVSDTRIAQAKGGYDFLSNVKYAASCRRGCAHCCYHPFLISLPEGILLYRYLVDHGKWNLELRQRVMVAATQVDGVPYEMWLLGKIPCPLLGVDRLCGAYEARPHRCRVTFSTGEPSECDPHRLSSLTALVPSAEAELEFQRGVQTRLRKVGAVGVMMSVAKALLQAEAIDKGVLDLREAEYA